MLRGARQGRRNCRCGQRPSQSPFDLADRFLEQQALVGDLWFAQRRCNTTELNHQSPSRTRVKRGAPGLVSVLAEACDGSGDELVVIGHRRRRISDVGECGPNCGIETYELRVRHDRRPMPATNGNPCGQWASLSPPVCQCGHDTVDLLKNFENPAAELNAYVG